MDEPQTGPADAPVRDSTAADGEFVGPVWPVVRPFVAFAAVLVLLALPPSALVAQIALVVAGVALLACAVPVSSSAPPRPGRALLLVGGALALIGPLLYSNPWVGIGSTDWIWSYWWHARRWTPRFDILLLVSAGVLGLVAGLRRRGTRLPTAVLAVTVLAVARGHAAHGPLALVSLERVNLLWTLSAVALAGGLLHLATASPDRRGTARLLAAAGALGIASVYVAWFPAAGENVRSSLDFYATELPVLIGAAFGGAEADPTHAEGMRQQFWAVGVPFLCQTASLALALLVAAVPARAGSRAWRFLAVVAWLLLLSTWIVPPRSGAWFRREEVAAIGAPRVAQFVGETLMKAGLSLWLVAGGAIAALLGAPRAATAPPPLRASYDPRRRALFTAALYAVAAVLALVVLRTSFDPDRGIVARGTVRDVAATRQWTGPLAILVFQAGFALAALAAVFLPAGRARGILLGIVALLALGALSPSGEEHASFAGVEWYLPPTLGVLAAGLCAPGGGGPARARRSAAVVAALLLVALLLYPTFEDPKPIAGGADFVMPFRTKLLTDTLGGLARANSLEEARRLLASGAWLALTLSLAAIAALGAVALRSRALATLATGTVVFGTFGGQSVLLVCGYAGEGGPFTFPSVLDALSRVSGALRDGVTPAVLGAPAGLVTDVLWRIGIAASTLVVPYQLALLASTRDLTEPTVRTSA